MDKGKAVMGTGRRWAVEFSDQSTVPSSRDILDPPGFSRASQEQVLLFFGRFCTEFLRVSYFSRLDLEILLGIELICYWDLFFF